jgi:hypothetical protein
MPTVLAKMNRNCVGAAKLGQGRSPNRVRFNRLPRLANRGDMIDIHT